MRKKKFIVEKSLTPQFMHKYINDQITPIKSHIREISESQQQNLSIEPQ